jgi:hypothetical protein
MRCGSYVAIWDGTIDGGTRLARPGIYYLRLSVAEENTNIGQSTVLQVQVPEP